HTSKEFIRAEGWKELAEKLKAPVKEGEKQERAFRAAALDALGAQGWELGSHDSIAVGPTFVETFTFKRRPRCPGRRGKPNVSPRPTPSAYPVDCRLGCR